MVTGLEPLLVHNALAIAKMVAIPLVEVGAEKFKEHNTNATPRAKLWFSVMVLLEFPEVHAGFFLQDKITKAIANKTFEYLDVRVDLKKMSEVYASLPFVTYDAVEEEEVGWPETLRIMSGSAPSFDPDFPRAKERHLEKLKRRSTRQVKDAFMGYSKRLSKYTYKGSMEVVVRNMTPEDIRRADKIIHIYARRKQPENWQTNYHCKIKLRARSLVLLLQFMFQCGITRPSIEEILYLGTGFCCFASNEFTELGGLQTLINAFETVLKNNPKKFDEVLSPKQGTLRPRLLCELTPFENEKAPHSRYFRPKNLNASQGSGPYAARVLGSISCKKTAEGWIRDGLLGVHAKYLCQSKNVRKQIETSLHISWTTHNERHRYLTASPFTYGYPKEAFPYKDSHVAHNVTYLIFDMVSQSSNNLNINSAPRINLEVVGIEVGGEYIPMNTTIVTLGGPGGLCSCDAAASLQNTAGGHYYGDSIAILAENTDIFQPVWIGCGEHVGGYAPAGHSTSLSRSRLSGKWAQISNT